MKIRRTSLLALAAGLGFCLAAQAAPVTKVVTFDSVVSPVPVPDTLALGDSFAASSGPAVTFYDFLQIYLPAASQDSWSLTALDRPNLAGLSALTSNLYQGQVSTVADLAFATLVEAGTAKTGLPPNVIGSTGKLVNLQPGWYTLEVTGTTMTRLGRNLGGSYGGTFTIAAVPVPEPETYAMLLAGLGIFGVVGRRRRSDWR